MVHLYSDWIRNIPTALVDPKCAELGQTNTNIILKYAGFLVHSALTLHWSPLPDASSHVSALIRAFQVLAPHARTTTEETADQLIHESYLIGVYMFYTSLGGSDSVAAIFDLHKDILAQTEDHEWKIAGQGIMDTLGATVTSVLQTTQKLFTEIETKWSARVSKWTQVQLSDYIKLPLSDKEKIAYLLEHPESADFPLSESTRVCKRNVETTRAMLDGLLARRQDVALLMSSCENSKDQTASKFEKVQKEYEDACQTVDDLERQFHQARLHMELCKERLANWTEVKAEGESKLQTYQKSMNDTLSRIGNVAHQLTECLDTERDARKEDCVGV